MKDASDKTLDICISDVDLFPGHVRRLQIRKIFRYAGHEVKAANGLRLGAIELRVLSGR